MYNRLSTYTPKLGICRGAQFLTYAEVNLFKMFLDMLLVMDILLHLHHNTV
jgi:gamma-glutamyl-gamma-aminobutyrate hydrolase PuuD